MDQALSCPVCFTHYNMTDKRPKTLKCGHSLCLACLKDWFTRKGSLICPTDSEVFPGDLSSVSDNQAIKDVLISLEVRCPAHPHSIVDFFCVSHMCVMCPDCNHTGIDTCEVRGLVEDLQEVMNLVIAEIEKTARGAKLAGDVKTGVEKRYKLSIGANVALLYKVRAAEEKENSLECSRCFAPANSLFDTVTFEAYCHKCQGVLMDDASIIDLSGANVEEVRQILNDKVKGALKRVCFSEITKEMMEVMDRGEEARPRDLQTLGKYLLPLESPVRCNFASLPNSFLCPSCKQLQNKSSLYMRVLPCKQLHAICENCVSTLRGQTSVICPLDKTVFVMRAETLPPLETGKRGELGARPPSDALSFNLPSQHPQSTPLPPIDLPRGTHCLTRFSTVLPQYPPPQSQMTPQLLGWKLSLSRGSTESVTFSCFDSCMMTGLGLANPILPGTIVVVDSVCLYIGPSATGTPLVQLKSNEKLVGGSAILSHISLPKEFIVPALTPVTLSVKFRAERGGEGAEEGDLWVFRGAERPEVCLGSDQLSWEFQEPKGCSHSQGSGGDNATSGPILRLLYQRR